MKSVPGRTHITTGCHIFTEKATSSWRLLVSEVTVRSKITTHQSVGPAWWRLPGSKRFHRAAGQHRILRAHMPCDLAALFFPALSAISTLWERRQIFARRGNLGARTAEPLAATRNLRAARQSSRVRSRASSYASSVIDASSGAVSMTLARRFIGVHAWS